MHAFRRSKYFPQSQLCSSSDNGRVVRLRPQMPFNYIVNLYIHLYNKSRLKEKVLTNKRLKKYRMVCPGFLFTNTIKTSIEKINVRMC